MIKKISNATLISSAISVVLLSSLPVNAETNDKEQCAGVVKAGLNDCGSTEHVCAGMNTDDSNSSDWLWLPKGTCQKILGAHVIIEEESS